MDMAKKQTDSLINQAVLDELLKGKDPSEFNEVFKELKKAVVERALGGELTHHLGYAPGRGEARRPGQSPQRHDAARRC